MTNLQNDKPLAGARQRKAMACRSVVMHNEKLSGRSDRDGRA